jgi:hypothetical protein
MSVILIDRPTITIQPPADAELTKLWDLAVSKVMARLGADPATRDDWNQVTRAYNALTTKPHGALSQMIRERCDQAPGGD